MINLVRICKKIKFKKENQKLMLMKSKIIKKFNNKNRKNFKSLTKT